MLLRSTRTRTWSIVAAFAATVAVWVWRALPVQAPSSCLPRGEGWHLCVLQHGWMPAITELAFALAIVWFAAGRLLRPRRRDATRARSVQAGPPQDPRLRQATWGRSPSPRRGRGR